MTAVVNNFFQAFTIIEINCGNFIHVVFVEQNKRVRISVKVRY